MNTRLFLVASLLLSIVTAAFAQEPGPLGRGGQGPFPGGRGGRFGGIPPRDNIQPTGTAKISGRVVSADTGTPLRRAHIRLTSPDARINRNATTDSDGRFEILSLPASRYRLYVSKAGYVTLEYGQARPFETGKPLDIAAGQSLEKIDFGLPRGSVITGRITDEFGEAVTDVQVQAMRYQFVNGERQLVNAGRMSTTDDLGQFRIFGLMPGEYVVRASMRTNPNPALAEPDAAAEVSSGYPGTYYPGVADVGQAQAVTVALGQELSSIAFSLVPAKLSRISGTVTSSNGRPLASAMVLLRAAGAGGAVRLNIGGGSPVRQDGTFRLTNVPPGDYVLNVQQRPRDLQNLQSINLGDLEFASVPLSVSGDIDGLSVVTTTGVSVPGRVVFQETTGQRPTARGIQITATAPTGDGSLMMAFAGRALGAGRVNNDGTFELRGLAGPQHIRAAGLPTGWAVKSMSLDGVDITDAPFDFKPGMSVTGLVITLTDRVTEITGSVRDSRGQAVADYVLVLFPENDALWGAQSRYVATTRPNQNGTFSITGLPPARYLAVALPSLENGLQNDVALLAQLRGRARSVTLAEGQKLSLNLEMAPP
ncbi:MAG TPA: carboxypeptidase-like regulatory domain-containing protein [Vicinamibacterales bacterium]|nr:carboxypeptidase-like regulatory domain-containing protein [Vicinamibacterales bacterium]